MSLRAKRHDRTGGPVVCRLWKTRRGDFQVFYFVAVRSFTADSSLLQPTRGVNTTTSHVHFRSVSTMNSRTD